MRCPYCKSLEDRVVDSRLAEGGGAIRRRRECGYCGRRYTTFERCEAAALRVVKRSGETQPFDLGKIIGGLQKACVNRPVAAERVGQMAEEIEEALRSRGVSEVPTMDIGRAVLDKLREVDEVAYLRFASVYQDFQEVGDFEREVFRLLDKPTPPKGARVPEGATGSGTVRPHG